MAAERQKGPRTSIAYPGWCIGRFWGLQEAILSASIKSLPMWYGSRKTYWKAVGWLKADIPHDDCEWQAQTDLAQTCLAEMM